MDIPLLISQHAEISSIVKQIEDEMLTDNLINSEKVRDSISILIQKISIHLAIEDKTIYPMAKESNNQALAQIAGILENEISSLANDFMAYNDKWATPGKIDELQTEFISETKNIFARLKKRITLEEEEFYPLMLKILTI